MYILTTTKTIIILIHIHKNNQQQQKREKIVKNIDKNHSFFIFLLIFSLLFVILKINFIQQNKKNQKF